MLELTYNDEKDVNELLDLIIEEAYLERASDIHLNPTKHGFNVRYRVDGIMRDITNLPPLLKAPLIKKIKENSLLDINKNTIPQDGKFTHETEKHYLDIRVSTLPSISGENTVMRILDKSAIILDMEKLGFNDANLKNYRDLLFKPFGMIVITAPTGCGKTTTAYAGLKEIATSNVNVITVEDPVEYLLDNVIHTQINPAEGMTFPATLKSILRQDPDIVFCGEIRDEETARLLIQTALTGHLVITILHARDCAEALTRLMDMGIEPFLLSSALLGVVAQRLVRKNCPGCTEEFSPSENLIKILKEENIINNDNITLSRGKGCDKCSARNGYKGRTAIHEVLVMDNELKYFLPTKPSYSELEKLLRNKGISSMKKDGLEKSVKGITTINEVMRSYDFA
jgi:type IV pilus assembly protein PilB